MLTGENGILTQAQKAKEEMDKASELEGIQLAVMGTSMKNNGYKEVLDTNDLKQELQKYLENEEIDVDSRGDGSFLVTVDDRKYYINNDKNVISYENILEINDEEELKTFRSNVNSGNTYEGWYIYLTKDMTLNVNEKWEPIGLYNSESTTAEDEKNTPFKGIFDGNGYEIDGIYINTTDKCQGLFGLVNNGKILNLGIGENCNISGGISTAAVAGYLINSYANNCYNKSDLTGGSYSGGVFGEINKQTKVENCYNLGDINTSDLEGQIGGITGQVNEGSQLYNCYNKGDINPNNNKINQSGGIVGRIINENGKIQKCYNTGNVNGTKEIGGIVGLNQGKIGDCYNTGNVNGTGETGGIVGNNQKILNNSYNIGSISSTDGTVVGGIAGQNDNGSIKNTYSLKGKCENIIGKSVNNATMESSEIKTEEDMKLLAPILGNAFKEDDDINNIKNNGYPILQWQ